MFKWIKCREILWRVSADARGKSCHLESVTRIKVRILLVKTSMWPSPLYKCLMYKNKRNADRSCTLQAAPVIGVCRNHNKLLTVVSISLTVRFSI